MNGGVPVVGKASCRPGQGLVNAFNNLPLDVGQLHMFNWDGSIINR